MQFKVLPITRVLATLPSYSSIQVVGRYPYSRAACEVDCFVQKVLRKCGCACDQFPPFKEDVRICNVTEMVCTFDAILDEHCHDCPDDCHTVAYEVISFTVIILTNLEI